MFKLIERHLPREWVLVIQLFVVLLWLAAAGVMLSGCSLLAPRLGPQIAKAATRYCEEPQAMRVVLRESINAEIFPNRIELACAADAATPDD